MTTDDIDPTTSADLAATEDGEVTGADPRDANDDSPPPVLPGMPLTSDPTTAPELGELRDPNAFDPFAHVSAAENAWQHAEVLGKTDRQKWAAVVSAVVESLGLAP